MLFGAHGFDPDAQHHVPSLGELDSVIDKIDQDLSKSHRVADQMIGYRRRG
jgi:hypothetical protein